MHKIILKSKKTLLKIRIKNRVSKGQIKSQHKIQVTDMKLKE